MEIIQKSIMKDGTKIQIEDWRSDYRFMDTFIVAAYPIAKESSNKLYIKRSKSFRLELESFKTDDKALIIFEKLRNGDIVLKECLNYFRSKELVEYL